MQQPTKPFCNNLHFYFATFCKKGLQKTEYKESDYIFKYPDGKLYHPDYPYNELKRILKKVPELPQGMDFHGLRRTCVSILVHQGKDIKSIQDWVGHDDVNTTLSTYAKVKAKDAKQEVLEAMNGIIHLNDKNKM